MSKVNTKDSRSINDVFMVSFGHLSVGWEVLVAGSIYDQCRWSTHPYSIQIILLFWIITTKH